MYIWTLASGLFEITWGDEGTCSFPPGTSQRIRTALQRASQLQPPTRQIMLHVMEEKRLGSTGGDLPLFIDMKAEFASTDVYLLVDDVDENGYSAVPIRATRLSA